MNKIISPVRITGDYPFSLANVTRRAEGGADYADLPRSLNKVLRKQAESRPEAEAVVEVGGERLTYGELFHRASRVSGGLRALGVERGSRVALRYQAGVNWVLAFWGTLLAGGVPVAVNTRFVGREVEYVLRNAEAVVDLTPQDALPDGEPFWVDVEPDDVAVLFYTSGTTGRPKGVPNTHRGILSVVEAIAETTDLPRSTDDSVRMLINVPLFHVTGCNTQLLTSAVLGGTSVIFPQLDPASTLDVIQRERINFLLSVPALFSMLLRNEEFKSADMSAIRWIGYGGAPAPTSLPSALRAAFPRAQIAQAFGMTELSAAVTIMPDDVITEHPESVGYPLPMVDLAIERVDDAGWGELLVRGPNVTTGYWNDPAATAESTVDGWFRTGDVARTDDAGRIYLVDRVKDIIIRGGENISSVEVEDALLSAPGVAEVAVIGVPDDLLGEKVGAIVVPADAAFDTDALVGHARERLADFKIPQYLIVADRPLPRTAAGKVSKVELRETAVWGEPLWSGTRSRAGR